VRSIKLLKLRKTRCKDTNETRALSRTDFFVIFTSVDH
jgi:hypothetical protein